MRKLIVSEMVTVDGFFAGPNGEIDWHTVDEEFNNYAIELINSIDTMLFGRVTYEGMASYWPTPEAITNDPVIANEMNTALKVVFSTTLDKVNWKNATLIKGDAAEEVAKLKQQPGKDMVIFGSGRLVSSLTQAGLIDEFRLIVNPVVLGSGVPLFKGMTESVRLRLTGSKTFQTGNVLLCYEPER
ncbi:MAG: dihydrofolate reductase family protein [Ktedonobacterales bacterium]